MLTSETDMGRAALHNFARSAGVTYDRMGIGRPLTPAAMGAALISILTEWSSSDEVGFRITADGLEPMSQGIAQAVPTS